MLLVWYNNCAHNPHTNICYNTSLIIYLLGFITQIGLDPSASCMQCSARIFILRAYGASKLCADLIIFVGSIGKTLQLLDLLFLCCDSYFSTVEVLGFFGCTMVFHSTKRYSVLQFLCFFHRDVLHLKPFSSMVW